MTTTVPFAPTRTVLFGDDAPAFVVGWERTAILVCTGDLGLACVADLRRTLAGILAQRPHRIVVDLGQVTWLDCATIGVLVQARQTARDTGGELVLRSPTPMARHVLALVGLADLEDGAPSVSDRVAGAGRRGSSVRPRLRRSSSSAAEVEPGGQVIPAEAHSRRPPCWTVEARRARPTDRNIRRHG